jgi:hypothetical protein
MFTSPSYKCAISDICMRRTFCLVAQSQQHCCSLKMQYFLLNNVTVIEPSLQVQTLSWVAEHKLEVRLSEHFNYLICLEYDVDGITSPENKNSLTLEKSRPLVASRYSHQMTGVNKYFNKGSVRIKTAIA